LSGIKIDPVSVGRKYGIFSKWLLVDDIATEGDFYLRPRIKLGNFRLGTILSPRAKKVSVDQIKENQN